MNILEKFKISPVALGLLQYIRLNSQKDEYIRGIVKFYLFDFETDSGKNPKDILEEAGYIKYIQGPKSRPWENIRLSDLGEKILKEMNQKPLHPLSEYMLEYTRKEYGRIGADKSYLKSGGKILHYISEFLEAKQTYTERMIRAVIYAYVSQHEFDQKYLSKMENLWFKSKNAFATKWNPDDCPLWQFIEREQNLIKHTYKNV